MVGRKLNSFLCNRWLVFVGAMWVQSWAGAGYLFGSISPVLKATLGYNQRRIASLGVAKDLGESVGFLAGYLAEILPLWAVLLVGAFKNFVGWGWLWLVVTGRLPALPLWGMCILILLGANGETYFNTAALVSCVQNFPKNRGPIVGILKGFSGLSGAILTQIYATIHAPDHASLIFMIAVGPSVVAITLMFIVRPINELNRARASDNSSFTFVYTTCLLLAAYLMTVMLLEDLMEHPSQSMITVFTIILLVLLLLPIGIPLLSAVTCSDDQELLLREELDKLERVPSEDDVSLVLASERRRRIARWPHRGEDFTLLQALIKADFWLIFISLMLGSGSGLTVIDNLGQMSQSFGYKGSHIFVSMISVWNFLGRIAGGYFSEIIVRDYAYPRPVALAVAQVFHSTRSLHVAMAWPGTMYTATLLIGLGYGAHWAIVPAAASELFGLRNFGALYNFITVANPTGALILNGLIASHIYDYEAERQAGLRTSSSPKCQGPICFYHSSLLMSGLCVIAVALSMILVRRTKIVYISLYGGGSSRYQLQ